MWAGAGQIVVARALSSSSHHAAARITRWAASSIVPSLNVPFRFNFKNPPPGPGSPQNIMARP
jgi:hypothetical protein